MYQFPTGFHFCCQLGVFETGASVSVNQFLQTTAHGPNFLPLVFVLYSPQLRMVFTFVMVEKKNPWDS